MPGSLKLSLYLSRLNEHSDMTVCAGQSVVECVATMPQCLCTTAGLLLVQETGESFMLLRHQVIQGHWRSGESLG